MALQYSVAVRNAKLDAIETTIGTAPLLKIYTGTKPANCAAAATGTVLASITLPSDWMGAASSGVKSKSGTWSDASADNSGTAGHFRIWDAAGTVCNAQGAITVTAGGGEMTVDNVTFTAGQQFDITAFALTAGNA